MEAEKEKTEILEQNTEELEDLRGRLSTVKSRITIFF